MSAKSWTRRVCHGREAGLAATPAWTQRESVPGSSCGYPLANAGEVNGDGYADLIVAASSAGMSRDGARAMELLMRWMIACLGVLALFVCGCSSEAGADGGEHGDGGRQDAATPVDAYLAVDAATAPDAGGCPVGETRCGGTCVDTTRAPAHCGSCGNACVAPPSSTATCSASDCAYACDPGYGDDGFACVPAPRPIAPVSTGTATTRRPTFRWALAPGVADTRIDLCADRACSVIIASSHVASGAAYSPATDLPAGVIFWRLHPGASGGVSSAVWQVTIPARSAPIDTSWGTTLDVNGDGHADVVAGTAARGGGGAYAYLGGASGPSATPVWEATGPPDSLFGSRVASAGDVDGDGYADLIVGAPGASDGAGAAFVYRGGPTGLEASPSWTQRGSAGARFGGSVASAGDVDGDGYGDVIVGADGVAARDREGEAYVYLGSARGLAATPIWTESRIEARGFGVGVSSAGDVNGDGYADVAVIEHGGNPLLNAHGVAHVYLGGAAGLSHATSFLGTGAYFGYSVASAGDVDGDGYADVVAGQDGGAHVFRGSASGVADTIAWTWVPRFSGSGGCAATSAGDLNADGYGDLAVGWIAGETGAGSVYVFLGSSTGLAGTEVATLVDTNNVGFGTALAGAGDVDGDGHTDLLVGAASDGDPLGPTAYSGAAHLFRGTAPGIDTVPAWTATGPPSSYFGYAVARTSTRRLGSAPYIVSSQVACAESRFDDAEAPTSISVACPASTLRPSGPRANPPACSSGVPSRPASPRGGSHA